MSSVVEENTRSSAESHAETDIYGYLRETREQAGLSLAELAERMDVRESFLEMLENGELDRKLGPGYVRNLVVRCGACLGLDTDDLLDAVQGRVVVERKRSADAITESEPGNESPCAEPQADRWQPPRRTERRVYETERRGHAGGRALRVVPGASAAAVLAAAVVLTGVWVGQNAFFVGPGGANGEDGGGQAIVSEGSFAPAALAGGGEEAGATTTSRSTSTTAQPTTTAVTSMAARSSDEYAVTFEANEEVWLEVIDRSTEEVLFSGTLGEGEDLFLDSNGALLLSTGRPGALGVSMAGTELEAPDAFRWTIDRNGISVRE